MKEYFYKDKHGKLKPYYYCSDCGKQYKDKSKLVDIGTERLPLYFCKCICYDRKMRVAMRNRDIKMNDIIHVLQTGDKMKKKNIVLKMSGNVGIGHAPTLKADVIKKKKSKK